jgi:hypothetical protein
MSLGPEKEASSAFFLIPSLQQFFPYRLKHWFQASRAKAHTLSVRLKKGRAAYFKRSNIAGNSPFQKTAILTA